MEQSLYTKMLQESFNMNTICKPEEFIDVPITEDINFEQVNLDIETLSKMKKNKFWNYLINNLPVHLRYGKELTVDELISYHPAYEEPLFKVSPSLHFFIEKMFQWSLRLTGFNSNKIMKDPQKKLKNLINLCIEKDRVLSDELFLTLIKLTRNNPNQESMYKAWELLSQISGILQPSEEFLYNIYNQLNMVIQNHPDTKVKEWARICLKRLYFQQKAEFKRNFAPSNEEIIACQQRKKLQVQIYIKNGQSINIFVESYDTLKTILKQSLQEFKIPTKYYKFYCLYETVEKTKCLSERLVDENTQIGDILSGWDIIKRIQKEEVNQTRLFLGIKYFPNLEEVPEMKLSVFNELIYNLYYGKIHVDRHLQQRLFGLCFQSFFGNYEEKPGFIQREIKKFFHPFFSKYYLNDKFQKEVIQYYQEYKDNTKEQCMDIFMNLIGDTKKEFYHYFQVGFRNSNNPNFKDLQKKIILAISSEKMLILEESSREEIMSIQFEQIMNWGINDSIFVVCHGDKYEVTKLYFQSYNPIEIAEIMYCYASQRVLQEKRLQQEYPNLDKFRKNNKIRKMNNFVFK